MTPDISNQQPLDDLEALIRLAGDYVQPSDDLRPRVLEAVRSVRRERQARRRIAQIAAVIFVAMLSAAFFYGGVLKESAAQASLGTLDVHSPPPLADTPRDSGWEMVESFTKLRRSQARLLRLVL